MHTPILLLTEKTSEENSFYLIKTKGVIVRVNLIDKSGGCVACEKWFEDSELSPGSKIEVCNPSTRAKDVFAIHIDCYDCYDGKFELADSETMKF